MKHSVEILNELSYISPLLAGVQKKNVFSVPEGYFINLHATILQQINNDKSISFTGFNVPVLSVPEGYFENLSSNILNKIKALQKDSALEELKKISPTLYSLQGTNVFQVPGGYFNQLADDIFQRTIMPQAKVVSMKQRSTVWKIAAAAMITGVIAVSSLWVSQKPIDNKTGLASNENQSAPALITPSSYTNLDQVNEGIAKLTDDDIIKYLQTTGNAADNEVLTASIEESELPAQQDYLLDEKTLQNYLNRIGTDVSN